MISDITWASVISETAAELAQLQHGHRGGLLALLRWAWLPHNKIQWDNCTWSSCTFKARIWSCICKQCCKFWLRVVRWALAGWAYTLPFEEHISHLWTEGSDPVTALGLARLNSVSWECLRAELSFETLKPESHNFMNKKNRRCTWSWYLCTTCVFPQRSLARAFQGLSMRFVSVDNFIFDEQS